MRLPSRASALAHSRSRLEERGCQFCPRANVQLVIHVSEVVLDRFGTQEQLGRGFASCGSVSQQLGDLELLRREVIEPRAPAQGRGVPSREKFQPRPLCPRNCAQPIEDVKCRTQLSARVSATPVATQAFAKAQVRAAELE